MKRPHPPLITGHWLLITAWFLGSLATSVPSFAQDWGQLATISSTMGVQGGKLCLGEASRGDIGCPAYAPSVATNGTLTATKFVGNGAGLTNLPTTVPDRIISNTTSVTATSSGLINLTTNGTTTGYFDTLGRLVAPGISLTTAHGISSTNGYFSGNVTVGYDDAITDTRLLTVKSAGYAGLVVNGDTTNVSGEPGGAYIAFGLDGIRPVGQHYLGMSNRSGEGPTGISVTNALLNSLVMGTVYADAYGNIQFAPGNAVNMTMLGTNGNIGIGKTNPVYPLEVSGTVRATTFIGDGSGLTGITGDDLGNHTATTTLKATNGTATLPAYTFTSDPNTGLYWVSADQIGLTAGGTQRLLVNTTGATVTGNFITTGSVSAASAAGSWVATQAEAEAGTNNNQVMTPLRVWQAITKALASLETSGTPTGQISAFNLTACPSGWSEYTPARGRFLRGIDSTGTNDSVRTAGNVQADALQGHGHNLVADDNFTRYAKAASGGGSGGSGAFFGTPLSTNTGYYGDSPADNQVVAVPMLADGTNGIPRTANETRPKNVAVLFCQKD